MTKTRKFPARLIIAAATVTGLTLVAVGCGSSSPKATPASNPTSTAATAVAVDSAYCKTARKWQVHELNGIGNSFASDPAALEQYWADWMAFIDTATHQAPAELRDDWAVAYAFQVEKFTPLLEKYDFDIERMKAEASPAELAVGKRVDDDPTPEEQTARDTVKAYEGRVCQTAQPPAADVSFKGAPRNKAYCDAVEAGDEAAGEVAEKKWSVDAVRAFVTSPDFSAGLDKTEANAPAEIKADVLADAEWQRNQQIDVLEKYGYDVRKLLLDGTVADRATFQRSDPAIAEHYARTVAYEEQLCGL